ncbi:AzlC family ABC transporter permease [Defluviitalea phaphyphila]|uniref:AzlC family ABC transporter permease n=1 Tax=Defluviitalea phaphyphila TaxID=1473580 RepID=UPI0007314794|nr:AzlC family ABC transporter permease [Defluviitalea phaphyphila]
MQIFSLNIFSTIKNNYFNDFFRGFKSGIPIALGYFPVSFTFGLMAVNGGLPVLLTVFISLSNFTSAGQFAGTSLIIANAPLFEIALTTFIINIRYMLMSLSLSQKITSEMSLFKRHIIAFGITDEIFAIASLEKNNISFSYMLGLIITPFLGWALGTATGGIACSILPAKLQSAMGIALYAMFIALIIPPAKKSKASLVVITSGVLISSIIKWCPFLHQISTGFRIIIATIIASSIGALFFPKGEEEL